MAFSPGHKHIIVNYHYVGEPRKDRGGFHPCSIKEFEKQVAYLNREFTMTSPDKVFEAAKKESPEKLCALTFDDGLKDNFVNAVPILEKYDVPGTFFIIADTFSGFLPATHKMHWLLSLKSAEELVDSYNLFLRTSFPRVAEISLISKTERLSRERKLYDDVPTANLKETMNRASRNIRDAYMRMLFKELALDERTLTRELFMGKNEIEKLHAMGHYIGSHGCSHEALDTMDDTLIKKEIFVSKKILEDMLNEEATIFAYPHSAPSMSLQTILEESGTHYAFTTERREVRKDDSQYMVPRYDTNDIRDFLTRSDPAKGRGSLRAA